MSPTLTFPSALLAALESAVRLMSLSFALTVSVPAVASTDVTSPVMGVGFAFVCAKLSPLKARVAKATIKTLIVFFTVSPPFSDLDVLSFRRMDL
jgi:hypothetical protein